MKKGTKDLSSYQRLKQENERLRNDIYTLIQKPETAKAITLKEQYKIQYDQIEAIMFGGRIINKTTFGGIFSAITPNKG